MFRTPLRALCMLSFCLVVAGAAGTISAQRASAQTPGFNPFTPNFSSGALGLNINGFGPLGVSNGFSPVGINSNALFPLGIAATSPFVTSYPFPTNTISQTVPVVRNYTQASASTAVSYSTAGTYPSSSTPFSANGTTIMGPDSCQLYDSYCAYCTNHPDASMCKTDPPVPLKSH